MKKIYKYCLDDDQVGQWAKRYKVTRAIDQVIQYRGFRIMLLLRLSPIIPFNGLNYFLGITAAKLVPYMVSMVGIIPGNTVRHSVERTRLNLLLFDRNCGIHIFWISPFQRQKCGRRYEHCAAGIAG